MEQNAPHPEVDREAAIRWASRELNDMLAVRAYEEGRGLASHRPIELYMQVASACNLDCYMCSEHNRPPEWRRGRGATSLPPELFAKVEEELFPYARRLTIGVGGEPMLSPHFLDYVRRAHAKGLDVHVMSNGTRIRNDEAAETLARCTRSMEISVDACTKETYERIRLGARWSGLKANLGRLVAAINALPEEERTHLTLCFVLMKSNVHEFPGFVEFGKHMGVDRVSGWHIIPVTEEGKTETLQTDRARSNELLEQAKRRGEELGVEVDVPAPFDLTVAEEDLSAVDLAVGLPEQVSVALATAPEPNAEVVAALEGSSVIAPEDDMEYEIVDHPSPLPATESAGDGSPEPVAVEADQPGGVNITERAAGMNRETVRNRAATGRIHCSSPTTSLFLFYDGRVLPCCHPHAHAQMPMGNLWESSFQDIWNGPLYRNLRAGLHVGDAPPLCQSCSIVHSPPPKVEDPDEWLRSGSDLRAWYAGRSVSSSDLNGVAPGWAEDGVLERMARNESELAQTIEHADTLQIENVAMTSHIGDIEHENVAMKSHVGDMEHENTALKGHADYLQDENVSLKGHIENLERVIDKTGAHRLYRWGSKIKDLLRGQQ